MFGVLSVLVFGVAAVTPASEIMSVVAVTPASEIMSVVAVTPTAELHACSDALSLG